MTVLQADRAMRGGVSPPGSLLRILGVVFGLAVLVGNTIGMGILRTPGEVAARLTSVPLFMAVWLAGAVYALLGALSVPMPCDRSVCQAIRSCQRLLLRDRSCSWGPPS